jgi:DNA uptake protein ComE-like DNA-binding protein
MARLFSKQEIRSLALLLPLLVVGVWIAVCALTGGGSDEAADTQEPKAAAGEGSDTLRLRSFDPNTVTYEELREMGVDKRVARGIVKYRASGHTYAIPEDVAVVYGLSDSLYALLKPHIAIGKEYTLKPYDNRSAGHKTSSSTRTFKPTSFDPNTLSAEGFYELGCFTARQAEALVEYRERMGGFRSLLEFRDCYLIDSALYAQMEPYITLSKVATTSSAPHGRAFRNIPFDPNTLTAEGFYELGCFSARQAQALVDYRTRRGGFRSELEWRDCYLIDSALWEQTKPYLRLSPIPKKLIDLNSADSLTLVALPGIGPRSASDIIAYRERLGGYYSVAQLLDLKVVTEENYALFCEEFWCDSCKIRKIDINFAPPKVLAEHPYITTPRLRKILLTRETKGGWKGLEEFRKDDIFESEEVERLAPYFRFDSIVIE